MNLLFHDRTTATPDAGIAVLTIEPSGNFIFSSGAAQALRLQPGTALALAEDADATARPWYLVLGTTAGPLKPFELRTSGGKNGQRLLFSSVNTARKFFAAHPSINQAKNVRLTIDLQPIEHLQAGQLWGLTVEGSAAAAAMPATAIPKPDRQFLDSCPYCKGEGEMFTNCTTPECQGKEEAWYGATLPVIKRATAPLPVGTDVPADALQQPDPVLAAAQVAENKRLHPEAVILPVAKRNPWSDAELATLRRLYPTTMAKDIALQLGRSLSTVQTKAHELLLKKGQAKKAKPPVVPTAPKASHHVEADDINPALAERLTKVVQRLAPMKLFKMDAHEAQQALKLLTTHRDKWDWVPGAAKLHERLDGCYAVPA